MVTDMNNATPNNHCLGVKHTFIVNTPPLGGNSSGETTPRTERQDKLNSRTDKGPEPCNETLRGK